MLRDMRAIGHRDPGPSSKRGRLSRNQVSMELGEGHLLAMCCLLD